jgi:hypothetical protein
VNAKPLSLAVQAIESQALLQDFPLQALLTAFQADHADDGDHHDSAFLDSCLACWIDGLEKDMRRYPTNIDEAHRRLHGRQSASREALIRLRQTLGQTPGA